MIRLAIPDDEDAIRDCAKDAYQKYIAVKNSAVGKGLGRLLIDYCEAKAMRIGLLFVELYTNESMSDNLSMYSHLGYTEINRRTEGGFRRIYFRKHLEEQIVE